MKSDAYYLAELEDKIIERVYEGTRNIPRPWGLVLSGGFDSGLLAALTKPDYIYSVSFPYGPKYDEGRYRDAIIKHLDLKPVHIITFRQDDFLPNLKEGLKIMGETTTHFSLAPLNFLMKELGTVPNCNVLSGEGPDEYLGGYARQIIFDELKKLYEIPELRNYHGMIKSVFPYDLVTEYGRMMSYDLSAPPKYIDSDYPLQGKIGKMDMELGTIEKMEQKLANVYNVNFHYPYIDEIFAEYCYELPDHLKIRNGTTKWAFRQICKKYLPEMMWDRSKMGGPVAPVNQWLMKGKKEGFDKEAYLELQKEILNEKA